MQLPQGTPCAPQKSAEWPGWDRSTEVSVGTLARHFSPSCPTESSPGVLPEPPLLARRDGRKGGREQERRD